MTSKEALEKISWRYPNDPSFQEWCNVINQSLERLELLEKENQKYLEELKRWGYQETPIHISKYKLLEIEHAKLKAKLYNLESHYELLENFTVPNLRKAIEILKDKEVVVGYLLICATLRDYNIPTSEEYQLTQQEFDLLKEVLESV